MGDEFISDIALHWAEMNTVKFVPSHPPRAVIYIYYFLFIYLFIYLFMSFMWELNLYKH